MPRDKSKDRTGERHGMLVAIRPSDRMTVSQARYWWYRCDCGTEVERVPGTLHNGSCGCVKGQALTERASTPERQGYLAFKSWAQGRGHLVEIEQDKWEALTNAPCVYCGDWTPPDVYVQNSNRRLRGRTIDRIDSNLGYLEGNCTSACIKCNYMKRHYTVEDFILHTIKIADYQRKVARQGEKEV